MDGTADGTATLTAVSNSVLKDNVEDLASKWYSWGLLRHGDCTMFEGAKWTLYSDGNAFFDATVTSGDDNDAWIIWQAQILDRNGAVLGVLLNHNFVPDDHRKFVCNMPDSSLRYRFFGYGYFDRNMFELIGSMNMVYSC